ncbi:MAG: hypothetical protein K1X29_00800 [Bdellovibrionales bacterium]|nr:hypothetical protein [Bdellovibrionales bacterium]
MKIFQNVSWDDCEMGFFHQNLGNAFMTKIKSLLLPITVIVGITIFSGCGKDNETKKYSVRRATNKPRQVSLIADPRGGKVGSEAGVGAPDRLATGGNGQRESSDLATTATTANTGGSNLKILNGTEITKEAIQDKLNQINNQINPDTQAIPLNDIAQGRYQLIELIIRQEFANDGDYKNSTALFTIDNTGKAEAFNTQSILNTLQSNTNSPSPQFSLSYPQYFAITKKNGLAQLQDTTSQSILLTLTASNTNNILFNYLINNDSKNLLSSLVRLLGTSPSLFKADRNQYEVSDIPSEELLNNRKIAFYQVADSKRLILTDFPTEDSTENVVQNYVYLIFNKEN